MPTVLEEYRDVEPSTKLSKVDLRPGPDGLLLSFSIVGGLRDAFGPDAWEAAYSRNDMMFVIRYSVELYRKGVISRRILGPLRFQKEARLYWSRGPLAPARIWTLIVDEDERTYIPASAEEAKQLLLDFERVLRPTLPRGRSEVWAEVEVRWWRHTFVDKGVRRGRSEAVVVEAPRESQGGAPQAGALRL